MGIFDRKTKAQLQETARELEVSRSHQAQLTKIKAGLETQVERYREAQEQLVKDILTLRDVQASYRGNEYPSYEMAVKAISEKYNGEATWGCLQVGTIVDLRSAFVLGDGVKIVPRTDTKDEAALEMEWAKDFFTYNGLDAEMAQELAKEAELEGKIALRLFYEDAERYRTWPGMVSVRFLSWLSKKYKIEADPQDYLWYKKLTWKPTGELPGGSVQEEEFVYKKFGGRISDPNDAQPKVMKCLTQIDRLDKALRDLREINHLFASPTPNFEVDEAKKAEELLKQIANTNWKIGKAIAHVGKFSLVSPDSQGIEMLIKEIELNVKMISGTTGIPIHYLGLLDLLHNRATGDNTRELVMAATARERAIWKGAFEELLEKAMVLFNEKSGQGQKSTKLDPEKIGVEIPVISYEHWQNIQNVLIPAAMAGIVSKEYVAGQIPGVDLEDEAAKREEREDRELERAKLDLERMRQQPFQTRDGAEDG